MLPVPHAFLEALPALGLSLAPEAIDQLGRFLTHLLETNEQFNLTAVRSWDEAWTRHVLDSLVLAPCLPQTGRVIDIGSGGGLPAIPLAILKPNLRFTLLEATGKKCRFLEDAAARLRLENVRVWQARAETAAHDPALRASFDACTSRAVAAMPVLVELCLPFLKVGGEMLAMKGAQATEECAGASRAIGILGGGKPSIRPFQHDLLPGACLVRIRQSRLSPVGYPRTPGKPGTDPIL